MGGNPTVVHITHPKAGSQWIRQILVDCVPDLVVPKPDDLAADPGQNPSRDFLSSNIIPGAVYPAMYLPKFMFDEVKGSEDCRRFVVIRDLRDTLVSGYFSILHSHPTDMSHIPELRAALRERGIEDGLIFLFDGFTDLAAAVQETWMEAGDPLLRYEDLLANDLELLEEVLLGHCGLPVPVEVLREKVLANRFERLADGRRRGQEDRSSHFRKGMPGDWINHFTPKVTRLFKERFGKVLIYAGYEKNDSW